MPLMRPPHYQGAKYNGTEVPPGGAVEVLARDVADMQSEGWKVIADTTLPPAAIVTEEE